MVVFLPVVRLCQDTSDIESSITKSLGSSPGGRDRSSINGGADLMQSAIAIAAGIGRKTVSSVAENHASARHRAIEEGLKMYDNSSMSDRSDTLYAILTGNLAGVQRAVEVDGVDPDTRCHFRGRDRPLLMIAMFLGNEPIARYLLDIGASVRFGPMELGHPINALDTAIDARMFNLASDLVTKRGMDPFSAEGRMKAISKFIKAAERDLRQNGRPSSSLGNNPALTSPTPIEQLILSGYGCDHSPDYYDPNQVNSVYDAFLNHPNARVAINSRHYGLQKNQTLLSMAIERQISRLADNLLARGANPTLADRVGNTSLHECLKHQSTRRLFKPLVEAAFAFFEANPNGKDSSYKRLANWVLHKSFAWTGRHTIEILLECKFTTDSNLDIFTTVEKRFITPDFERFDYGNRRESLLTASIHNRNPRLFLALLLAGFNPLTVPSNSSSGKSALQVACGKNISHHTEEVFLDILIETGFARRSKRRLRPFCCLRPAAIQKVMKQEVPSLAQLVRNSMVKKPVFRAWAISELEKDHCPQQWIDWLEFKDLKDQSQSWASRVNAAMW